LVSLVSAMGFEPMTS